MLGTRRLLPFLCVLGALASTVHAQAGAPRLIVLLVADQMRADYVDRFGHQWSAGLRRLFEQGARFARAAYPYANTVTCSGHATLSTGTTPSRHGLVLNEWWDRQENAAVPCSSDPDARNIGHGGRPTGGDSARQLLVPTLGDELRAQLPRSPRVAALSFKARSAVMLGGHAADLVLWFHEKTGAWTTSSAYASGPIPFVDAFVREHPVAADAGKAWTLSLPFDAYDYEDDAIGERPVGAGQTPTFPHAIVTGDGASTAAPFATWQHSPFADEYLADLAMRTVDELALGQRGTTDLLAVGFSALDEVGHKFGPKSLEVQDLLVRLDRTIGRLLDHLDARVGPGRYVVAFSSDHGVAPIPEQMQALGLDAGRTRSADVEATVDRVLSEGLGPGQYVARAQYSDLYLRPGVFEILRSKPEVLGRLRSALLEMPGLREVYAADEVGSRAAQGDEIARALARSYREGRSGDLLLVTRPYWFHARGDADATTHGSASGYDRAVPVALMGPGIRPGTYLHDASPLDIVPTLAFLSGVTLADAEGRLLVEALAPASGTAAGPGAR